MEVWSAGVVIILVSTTGYPGPRSGDREDAPIGVLVFSLLRAHRLLLLHSCYVMVTTLEMLVFFFHAVSLPYLTFLLGSKHFRSCGIEHPHPNYLATGANNQTSAQKADSWDRAVPLGRAVLDSGTFESYIVKKRPS